MHILKDDEDHLYIETSKEKDFPHTLETLQLQAVNSNTNSLENHHPFVLQAGNTILVNISEVMHPMEEEHSITTIFLETEKGGQYRILKTGEKPVAKFNLASDDVGVCIMAYCNQHGLWRYDF
ncbi:superoxide reductase [Lachnospiraceae bacterium KM106-2]|nr:superoxide reductase [Lachnospiraceae bacterium KM106-2]